MIQPDEAIVTILQDFMGLPRTHCFLGGEGILAPTSGLFAIVTAGPSTVIAKKSEFINQVDPVERLYSVMVQDVTIDICSPDREADERHEDVIMAISGILSQSVQENLTMKFSVSPTVLNLTAIEGASNLHRYRITVRANYIKALEKTANQYYDKHRVTEVTT
jgi:hypothetical protein